MSLHELTFYYFQIISVVGVNSMKDGFLYGLDCFDLHKVAPTTQKEAIRWCASTPPPFVVNVEKAIRSGVPGTKRSTNFISNATVNPIASKRKSSVGTDDKENSSNCVSELSGETDDMVDVPKNNSTKPKRTNTKVSSTKRTSTLGGAKKTGKSAATKSTSRAKDTSTKSSATVKNATKANGGRGRIDFYESDSDSDVSTSNTQKASSGGTGFGATVGGNGASKRSSNAELGRKRGVRDRDDFDLDDFVDNNENIDCNRPKSSGIIDEFRKKTKEIEDNKLQRDMREGIASVAAVRATFGNADAKEYEKYLKANASEISRRATSAGGASDYRVSTQRQNHDQGSSGIMDKLRKKTKEIEDKKLESDMWEGTASVAAVRATFGDADAKEYEKYLKSIASEIGSQVTSAGYASDNSVSTHRQNHDQGSPSAVLGGERAKTNHSTQFRNLSKLDRRSFRKQDRLSGQDIQFIERSRSRTRISSSPPNYSYNREGRIHRADSQDRDSLHTIDDDRGNYNDRRDYYNSRSDNRRDYNNRSDNDRRNYNNRSDNDRRNYNSRSDNDRRDYNNRSDNDRRDYNNRSDNDRRDYNSRSHDDSLTLVHARALAYLSHASSMDKFGSSYR